MVEILIALAKLIHADRAEAGTKTDIACGHHQKPQNCL